MIEDLLQENSLTLFKAVTICRSCEAVKKYRQNIHTGDLRSVVGIAAMHRPKSQQFPQHQHILDVVSPHIKEATINAQPTIRPV